MSFCVECGKPVRDDAQFCPACGTPVKGAASSTDGWGREPAPAASGESRDGKQSGARRLPILAWIGMGVAAAVVAIVVLDRVLFGAPAGLGGAAASDAGSSSVAEEAARREETARQAAQEAADQEDAAQQSTGEAAGQGAEQQSANEEVSAERAAELAVNDTLEGWWASGSVQGDDLVTVFNIRDEIIYSYLTTHGLNGTGTDYFSIDPVTRYERFENEDVRGAYGPIKNASGWRVYYGEDDQFITTLDSDPDLLPHGVRNCQMRRIERPASADQFFDAEGNYLG